MKLVATVMVRDEVDVVAAMVEHHLAQGVDLIIATDNGSVDGTTEVLQAYADLGVLELHHDPVHRKQQHAVVTTMARRAFTEHGADWVLNIDADEFWVPLDKALTLRTALEHTPTSLQAFTVAVTNLVGPPAVRGAGIDRLVWRDLRSEEQLRQVGIFAQPTPNAVHCGSADVTVAQGNHFVSLDSTGQPDDAYALEVLHLPWRSWEQLERKVVNAGLGYEASPDLRPSKNHHGMADYRRYTGGRLRYTYLLRVPPTDELTAGQTTGSYRRDTWLRDHLHALTTHAHRPDLLAATLDPTTDEPIDPTEHRTGITFGHMLMDLEHERDTALQLAEHHRLEARALRRRRPGRVRLLAGRVARRLARTGRRVSLAAPGPSPAPDHDRLATMEAERT